MKHLVVVGLVISTFLAIPYEVIGLPRYYSCDKCGIEARFVALPEHVSATKDMRTTDGKLVKVSTKTIFHPSDILGVEVEDDNITIHFKRDAWAQIREKSSLASRRKIALIKDGVIFQMAPLMSRLDRSATLTARKLDLDDFLRGFKATVKPDHLGAQTEYVRFLEEWYRNHPDEPRAMPELAYAYMEGNTKEGCEKAITIFEEMFNRDPTAFGAYLSLIQCYVLTRRFDKAVERTKTAIKKNPGESQWFLHLVLGTNYAEIGRKDQALKALEQSLALLKALKIQDMSKHPGLSKTLAEFGPTFDKKETIEKLNQLIEELKSSQGSQK